MEYPEYVEVCGKCGSLITWNKEGDPVCNCMDTLLYFIEIGEAKELGILKE